MKEHIQSYPHGQISLACISGVFWVEIKRRRRGREDSIHPIAARKARSQSSMAMDPLPRGHHSSITCSSLPSPHSLRFSNGPGAVQPALFCTLQILGGEGPFCSCRGCDRVQELLAQSTDFFPSMNKKRFLDPSLCLLSAFV